MHKLKLLTFMCLAAYAIVSMTSCSSSKNALSSKYSSREKREKQKDKPANEQIYTKEKKPNDAKSSNTKNSVTGIRLDIINTAMNYLGTSYKSGGKSPESGFDCSGFAGYVFSQNGIRISGSSDSLAKLGKNKERNELVPGDLVFFGNTQRISHVAIVSENKDQKLKVIHATTSAGVKTDIISDYQYWESRYLFGKDIISR